MLSEDTISIDTQMDGHQGEQECLTGELFFGHPVFGTLPEQGF